MAFEIKKTLDTKGIALDSYYVRFSSQVDVKWDIIRYTALRYASKATYEENQSNNVTLNCIPSEIVIDPPIFNSCVGIPQQGGIPYNREVDGNDLLQLTHDAYKATLLLIEVDGEKLFTAEEIVETDMDNE